MKKIFLLLLLLGMVSAVSATDIKYVAMQKSGFNFEVAAEDAAEIKTAKWCYVFRLECSSSINGDNCWCGMYNGEYYISSPDYTQEYVVNPKKGLTRVINATPSFEEGVWAEYGESLANYKVKYVYGYDDNENVFVVIYGK